MAHRKQAEKAIDINVPITPMLDMSFQLLSFFILTFRPMPTEGQLSINLPKLDATELTPQVDPLLPEDKKDEYTVSVASTSGGEIALLGLKGPTVNSESITKLTELLKLLEGIPKPGGQADRVSITIEAADDLNYARLIEIMDLCKKAGYDSVNLMKMKK